MPSFISRKRSHDGFSYYRGKTRITNTAEIERINKLAIPPAWRRVEIATSKKAKVLATGYDRAGRKQAIYHPDYRLQRDAAKFERILRFADKLPTLRRRIERDLRRKRLSKEKVLALIVKLIDEAYFRVGNEQYARENQTYGITTIRSKHVDITTTSVTFDFIGKSGQNHHRRISDRHVARIMKQLDELPGYDLFRYVDTSGDTHPITSEHVNTYIKETMGDDFTAKDFRTWGGTMLAASNLAIEKRAKSVTARKKYLTSVIKDVAKRLGNTPAVARSSYIDPRIIDAYMDTDTVHEMYRTMRSMKPRKYLKNEERAVIELLRSVA